MVYDMIMVVEQYIAQLREDLCLVLEHQKKPNG